ncbi:MAG TPA: response regulator [Anaerolineae bacterium]|nr:response regulator [Anaerolineae bacterium]
MSKRHSILIVEDDPWWQEVLREPLEDEGYAVTILSDYQEARRALDEHRFALVILDLLLDEAAPMLDGERLLAHIARRYPGLPCVIVSGRGDTRVVRDAFKQYHVVDYVDKGQFDILAFVELVQAAIGASTPDHAVIRRILNERFDLEEIKNLCFDLDIDFDSLEGEGKKTRGLVAYCRRCDRLGELVALVRQLRPGAL